MFQPCNHKYIASGTDQFEEFVGPRDSLDILEGKCLLLLTGI